MTTNEFERDLNDQSGLKRAGRVDLRVFQNTADAGDGHPGVQRCFRNYLHEGGMEKDLQLIGHGIIGDSVDINNAELQQLSNIGGTTIDEGQWGYVGGADQSVKQADSPTFGGITVNGNIVISGNVDGVDISAWLDQSVKQADSPTFVGLTLSADLVTTSTVDGVDVSDLKTAFDTHKDSDGSDHTFIDQSVVAIASPTFVGLTLSADIVTTSTVDGVDVSVFKTESDAYFAIGSSNARYATCKYIGESTNTHVIYDDTVESFTNATTGSFIMFFEIPCDSKLGSKNLYVSEIVLGISFADADDFVDMVKGDSNSSYNNVYNWFPANSTDRTTGNQYSYPFAAASIGGYKRHTIGITCSTASIGILKISYVLVKYYYA